MRDAVALVEGGPRELASSQVFLLSAVVLERVWVQFEQELRLMHSVQVVVLPSAQVEVAPPELAAPPELDA